MRLHSDNAKEFRSELLAQVKDLLNLKGTFITPYRPKTNGLCERTNATVESILRCLLDGDDDDTWDKVLPFAIMAYRATPHASTGLTPNMLVFGRECVTPADIMFAGQYTKVVPKVCD